MVVFALTCFFFLFLVFTSPPFCIVILLFSHLDTPERLGCSLCGRRGEPENHRAFLWVQFMRVAATRESTSRLFEYKGLVALSVDSDTRLKIIVYFDGFI